jgi:hypothetical protein
MKDIKLIVWLTQLGLQTAFPLAGFILLAVWLRSRFDLGPWVIWIGIILGFVSAIDGFRTALRAMTLMSKSDQPKENPPVSFNEHN